MPAKLLLSALLLLTTQLQATTFSHTIEVIADMPRKGFEVSTPGSDPWLSTTQQFSWDLARRQLSPISKQLYLRSSHGAINARFTTQPQLYDIDGVAKINVNVRVNGVMLSNSNQQVLAAAEASTGKTVAFELLPQTPAGGYRAGSYTGVVSVIFEAGL